MSAVNVGICSIHDGITWSFWVTNTGSHVGVPQAEQRVSQSFDRLDFIERRPCAPNHGSNLLSVELDFYTRTLQQALWRP